jgi:putative OPT family oligopeptide transporter
MAAGRRKAPARDGSTTAAPEADVPTRAAAEEAPAKALPEEHRPYIPASTTLPELTIKVFVIGILLSFVMASANAYLGLFAALTVSAAIPASVISMAVLRFFKRRNILENNLIQTTASAGESVVAGIIFTLPALLMLGYWKSIGIVETMVIAALGGSLGVLFTIPLRRAFIVDAKLLYPEGVATVEVLKSGEKGGTGIGYILLAAITGAVYKFMGAGLALWNENARFARRLGDTALYAGGTLSPALIAVGFIIGLPIAVLIFAGGVIGYVIAAPLYLATHAWPVDASGIPLTAINAIDQARGSYVRFIGVGGMAAGGVYTLFKLRHALVRGVRSGMDAYHAIRSQGKDTRQRTERDMNMRTVLLTMVLFAVPLSVLFSYFVTDHFRNPGLWWVGVVLGLVMLAVAFLFSAVAGYMAGVVGSSNNPISGTAIGTIIFTALVLVAMGVPGDVGAAATILIGGTVAAAAAIAGDNMQDLKAGHLLGGTPRNLQIMQMVGTIAASLVIPFILILLDQAYGLGLRPACDPSDAANYNPNDSFCLSHPNPLQAPQASLMKAIAQGIFGSGIPWDAFWIGVAVAALIIGFDKILEWRGARFRTPVLAVAIGIYLPFELATPIFLGGLVAWGARRWFLRGLAAREPKTTAVHREAQAESRINRGVLFASGLIAGESLVGILIAALIVSTGQTGPAAVFTNPLWYWEGLIVLLFIAFLLGYSVVRRGSDRRAGS